VELSDNKFSWPYKGSNLVKKEDLKPYLQRNNIQGLKHLSLHLSLILFSGLLMYYFSNSLFFYAITIFHGTFIAFLYAGMHECIHKTPFKNRKLNEFVGYLIGFILFRSFLNGRYRHMAHHTFTQHPQKDPDKVEFPTSYIEYLKHITSFVIWIRILDNLFRHTLGKLNKNEKEYIPSTEVKNLFFENRCMVLGYLILLLFSIIFQTWFLFFYWILPRVLGEPFLRLFRMAEHTGKDESPNMIQNTRTSLPSKFVKFLYWNMPYHTEHHIYSNIPFHKLPKFHQSIKSRLSGVEPTIFRVHIEILKQIWINKKSINKKNILKV
tara:strand:+ start:385 stop:1353 length:969 start_codon:yes stop_codon:yes gene_type:complete